MFMIISFIIVKKNEKCKNGNPLKFYNIYLIWTQYIFKFKNIKLTLLDLILIIILHLLYYIIFTRHL